MRSIVVTGCLRALARIDSFVTRYVGIGPERTQGIATIATFFARAVGEMKDGPGHSGRTMIPACCEPINGE
jgi:hypothetical protein